MIFPGRHLWLLFLIFWFPPAGQALENELAGSGSPYLEMHAGDPVHWQRWGPAVLELARKEGKPIFISSGYFACHWCHVMQRESYRNPEIARLLNDRFIPVKVDRELDPALDDHLIDFVQRTQGHAGWPLNVFLTPEGYPLVGFTYLPPDRFAAALEKLSGMWRSQHDKLLQMARRALEALVEARKGEAVTTVMLDPEQLRKRFIDEALELADPLSGGFGQQSRFPMQPQLHALLTLSGGHRAGEVDSFLRLTLEQMARLGLRDHLDGGFFRYTVDPQWQTPHYEKMLYNQALLAMLYLEAARRFRQPEYREVAFDTLDFVLRRMQGKEGGCVASFSAVDDRGVEGGYYLWRREELESLFAPDELPLVLRHWRFAGWEQGGEEALPLAGEPVASLARDQGVKEAEMARRVEQWRQRLLQVRSRRSLPVDRKQLAGWNGLLLAALAEASRAPGGARYREPGARLARYLSSRHWDGSRLWRTLGSGGQRRPGTLEDHAYVAFGLQRWAEAEDDGQARKLADRLVHEAWRRFHDASGWHLDDRALLPGMPAAEAQEDGALPAPAAVVLALSLASEELRPEAEKVLLAARPQVQAQPFWHPSYLLMMAR